MSTLTENRINVAPTFPKYLSIALEEDAAYSGVPQTSLIRRMIKWHAGRGEGRNSKAKKVTAPKRLAKKGVKKSFLIDEDDAKHIDKLCARTELPRVGIIILIVLAWFEIDPIPKIEQ